MADLIGLINEISTAVKLAWVGVLVWGAVQFFWYRGARILPEAMESSSESSSSSWSTGFSSVTQPPEDEPIETPRARGRRPASASAAVDIGLDGNAEIAPASDENAAFHEAVVPRKKSSRRRRSAASNEPSGGVPDFALDTPEAN